MQPQGKISNEKIDPGHQDRNQRLGGLFKISGGREMQHQGEISNSRRLRDEAAGRSPEARRPG